MRTWAKWTSLSAFITCVGLLVYDQHTGGPIGREQLGGWKEGYTGNVGETAAFGGDAVYNPTWLPIRILSITPVDQIDGVSFVASVAERGHADAVASSAKVNGVHDGYGPVSLPVTLPAGQTIHSVDQAQILITARASKPGDFVCHGVRMTYKWGPFQYTTVLPETCELKVQGTGA